MYNRGRCINFKLFSLVTVATKYLKYFLLHHVNKKEFWCMAYLCRRLVVIITHIWTLQYHQCWPSLQQFNDEFFWFPQHPSWVGNKQAKKHAAYGHLSLDNSVNNLEIIWDVPLGFDVVILALEMSMKKWYIAYTWHQLKCQFAKNGGHASYICRHSRSLTDFSFALLYQTLFLWPRHSRWVLDFRRNLRNTKKTQLCNIKN